MDRLISKRNTWMKLERWDRAKSMTKLLNLVDDLLFDNLIQRIDNNGNTNLHRTNQIAENIDFIFKRENICELDIRLKIKGENLS